MSGVCGVVRFDGAPADEAALEAMLDAAPHRGPDGTGRWLGDGAALGHLALHVTPEDTRERQPLARHGLVLAADARIDNRAELLPLLRAKKLLPAEGTTTDADVILAAYRLWGAECAAHLLGDFAFVVWDESRREAFAARDAMGMRALYHRFDGRRWLFATEAKQILAVAGVPRRLFEPAIAAHLTGEYGRLEWSFFEGIEQLPPAHALRVGSGGVRAWRYWDLDAERRIRHRNEGAYAEEFRELLLQAVRARSRCVGRVGVSLSGGLDSGSIAAAAGWLARQGGGDAPDLLALSFAFADEELRRCDERHLSAPLAEHFGIEQLPVWGDDAWPLADYPAHGPDADEPFVGAFQPLFERMLAVASAHGARLVMSGDRGDLLVGEALFDHLGLLAAGRPFQLLAELRCQRSWHHASWPHLLKRHLALPLAHRLLPPGALERWQLRRHQRRQRRQRLQRGGGAPAAPPWVRSDLLARSAPPPAALPVPPRLAGRARRERYRLVFTPFHMRGVVWSERTHARAGLAFADPFSDRRLAEYVLAIPQWLLQQPRAPKRLTREALRGIAPEAARERLAKIYPTPLYHRGLRRDGRATVLALLRDSRAHALGFLDAARLREHYEDVAAGAPDHADLWSALTLEMWLRRQEAAA